jgi:hypothetical protein
MIRKTSHLLAAALAAVSPDGKTVAYEYRTPSSTGQFDLWPAPVAYDLAAPPALKTLQDANSEFPCDRGVVLDPEQHRASQRYWILLDPGEGMSGGAPRFGFTSPIAWSPDSKCLAVVERQGAASRLVVVDVSNGLRRPSVTTVPVRREAFLESRYQGAIPKEYEDTYVLFKELRALRRNPTRPLSSLDSAKVSALPGVLKQQTEGLSGRSPAARFGR